MRVVASADILRTHNGKKSLTDDVFVGLDGNEQSIGITPFAPTLRNESYEARRQTYLKAIENLLGIKRGILSDAEAVSKTATEINSSAGDYSCRRCGYLHWWEFLGAFHGIGDGLFAQVVNIRNKRARGKMLDKSEQEFARENAAVIKIHAAESVEDKAEKERLLDLLGR